MERQPYAGHEGTRGNTSPSPRRDSATQVNPVQTVAFQKPPQATAIITNVPGVAYVAKYVEGKE